MFFQYKNTNLIKSTSKCESEWDDCIKEDERYLREKTDYYERFYGDTCPSYSPDDEDDPYPGQPFVENRQKPPPSYGYNQHEYNKYRFDNNQYHQHATRRQEDVKVQDGSNCRVYTGPKGERVRCDTNIEIRNAEYEDVRNIDVAPYDPCADGQDTSGLCFDDDEE